MLHITVNGNVRQCPTNATVADLIQVLGVVGTRVAIERNGTIVPRSLWWETRIQEGDRLEIVGAVGGG
jgi:sulfur carrier protein